MNRTVNQSEQFVYKICRGSFLSLWSYANPKSRNHGKELCDILVVCDPDIIIFSVKEIELKDSGIVTTDLSRWQRRAIGGSVKQIYGAERSIENTAHVIRNNGTLGLALPTHPTRRIHRIGAMPLT